MTFEELCAALGIDPSDANRTALTQFATAREAPLKANRDALLADNRRLKDGAKAFEGFDVADLTTTLAELNIDPAELTTRLRAAPSVGAEAVRAAEAAAEARNARKIALTEKRATDADARAALAERARCDADASRALTDEIAKKKGNATILLPTLKGRVKSSIDPDTGRVILTPLSANGDEMLSDAGVPASIGDLVESLRRDETWGIAFEADGGGSGAGNAAGKAGSRVTNPWLKSTFNMTEQARLKRDKPALAATLQREAANKAA